MLALAFECAGQGMHAALAENGSLLAEKQVDMDRGQPAALLPFLHQLFTDAGREVSDLDRVAVTRGPGGFTGIRLGLSVALGLSRATGAAFFGCNAFDVYALEQEDQVDLAVVIESRRKELFFRCYDSKGEIVLGDAVLSPDDLNGREGFRFFGSAAETLDPAATNRPPNMALLAAALSHTDAQPDWLRAAQDQSSPLYLREPEIGAPKSA